MENSTTSRELSKSWNRSKKMTIMLFKKRIRRSVKIQKAKNESKMILFHHHQLGSWNCRKSSRYQWINQAHSQLRRCSRSKTFKLTSSFMISLLVRNYSSIENDFKNSKIAFRMSAATPIFSEIKELIKILI